MNKADNDSKITGLLYELRKSFPQLDDWVNIYPTPSIKLLVAEVYKQVIDFGKHTAQYFTHFSSKNYSNPPESRSRCDIMDEVQRKFA